MGTVLAGTGDNREIWRRETVTFYDGKPGTDGATEMSYEDLIKAIDDGIVWENPMWKVEAMGHQEHTLTDELVGRMKEINEKVPSATLEKAKEKAAESHEPKTDGYWIAVKRILDEQGLNWYSPKDMTPWPASRS